MHERIAIISGLRTPFCKAGGAMKECEPDDLGAFIVHELLMRSEIKGSEVDELVFGNVSSAPQLANIARIVSVKAGLPTATPAFTVSRNCASGMEAIATAANTLLLDRNRIVIAGGTESMSNISVLIKKKYKTFLQRLNKSKGWKETLSILCSFRPSFLVPEIPEIADPLCGLSMGQTAELVARDFRVTREEQDQFALLSQQRAEKADAAGILAEEIAPMPLPPAYKTVQQHDEGIRKNQTLEALAKLKPSFDQLTGTVTAGNSSQITDGAAALLLMKESAAKERGLKPLGYLRSYAAIGLAPSRMGLGPAYAIAKLLKQEGMKLSDFDLIEINEAFAAQVLAVIKACASEEFARKELGIDKPLGEISLDKLNVNGGAIALGHPLGASGARLVLTLLKELGRRKKQLGLAALCVGGGQGEAMILEVH
jgi:acetyl-CoA acyltransferase